MSISVTIHTNTAAEMNAEILRLAQRLEPVTNVPTGGVVVNESTVHDTEPTVTEAADEPVAEEPKRRTRRTKAEMQAAAAAPVEAPSDVEQPTEAVATEEPAVAKVTMDNVRAALQRVAAVKDMVAAKELLNKVGAKRLSEVPEAKYAEFVALCDALVPPKKEE